MLLTKSPELSSSLMSEPLSITRDAPSSTVILEPGSIVMSDWMVNVAPFVTVRWPFMVAVSVQTSLALTVLLSPDSGGAA